MYKNVVEKATTLMIKYKCLGALLMKCTYEYALGMMKQGNKEMAEIIDKFFNSVPEDLAKKIHLGKEKGSSPKLPFSHLETMNVI